MIVEQERGNNMATTAEMMAQAITFEEIEKTKKRMKIGSTVRWRVYGGEPVENIRSKYPRVMKKLVLTGKYPFFATARDERTGLVYSLTWPEIVAGKREKR